MLFPFLLITHVTGTYIWIGCHLLLCIRYLPGSLNTKDCLRDYKFF
jgi:hypothetical protein